MITDLAVGELKPRLVVEHDDTTTGPEPSLSEQTRLMREGGDEAWNWFHQRYYLALLRYAASRTASANDAQEIVQLAYLRIARHVRPFDNNRDFWLWLVCLVRCTVVDHARAITRRNVLLEKFAHWRESRCEPDHATPPANNTSSALAEEALAKLPDSDARLLRLKYYEGWSVGELAAEMETTSKAMENRLARLRQRLRDIILRIQ